MYKAHIYTLTELWGVLFHRKQDWPFVFLFQWTEQWICLHSMQDLLHSFIYFLFSGFLQQSPSPWVKLLPYSKEPSLSCVSHITSSLHSQESLKKSPPHWLYFLTSCSFTPEYCPFGFCTSHAQIYSKIKSECQSKWTVKSPPAALGTAEHAPLATLFPLFWILLSTSLPPWFPTRGRFIP